MNFPIGGSYKATMFVLVFASVMFFVAIGTKEFFQKDKPDVKGNPLITDSILSTHIEYYYLEGVDNQGNTVFYKYRAGQEKNGPVDILTESEFIAITEKELEENRKEYKPSTLN